MKIQVVAAVIQKEDKFLLGKRALSKKSAPGYWCPVSGRIEAGETEQEAVVREVFEEVGLIVESQYKIATFESHDGLASIHWWKVDVISGDPSLANDEHSEIGWFSVSEMEKLNNVFTEDLLLFKTLISMAEYNWQPMFLEELTEVFSSFKPQWIIAGGWALDLFLGKQTRAHGDIDVLIERNDQLALQELLKDWDVWVADPPGTLRPWKKGEHLGNGIQDIWCRKTANSPWQLQVMLFDVEDGSWVFKRDKSIRKNLKDISLKTQAGFNILAPEVQLLYKSKSLRDKDRFDFDNALSAMSADQKAWLKEALMHVYGNQHEWISQL